MKGHGNRRTKYPDIKVTKPMFEDTLDDLFSHPMVTRNKHYFIAPPQLDRKLFYEFWFAALAINRRRQAEEEFYGFI